MKSAQCRFLRLSLPWGFPLLIACANATQSDIDDGSVRASGGRSSNPSMGSGGRVFGQSTGGRSSGGSEAQASAGGGSSEASGGLGGDGERGGAGSTTGGSTNTGGSNASGGASMVPNGSTGGAFSDYEGDCEGKRDLQSPDVGFKEYVVYTCQLVQAACTADLLGEPALFQCTDAHVNNCRSQEPTGSNSWTFVGLCSELGLGGAGGQLL